jgi:hypothetical protein
MPGTSVLTEWRESSEIPDICLFQGYVDSTCTVQYLFQSEGEVFANEAANPEADITR